MEREIVVERTQTVELRSIVTVDDEERYRGEWRRSRRIVLVGARRRFGTLDGVSRRRVNRAKMESCGTAGPYSLS